MNGGDFSSARPSRLVLRPATKIPAVILEAVVIAATKIETGLPGSTTARVPTEFPVTLMPQPKGLGRCTGSIGAMASSRMRATPPQVLHLWARKDIFLPKNRPGFCSRLLASKKAIRVFSHCPPVRFTVWGLPPDPRSADLSGPRAFSEVGG